MSETGMAPQREPKPLEIKAASEKKRNYIFDFSKALRCPHRTMRLMVVGGNTYRCEDCNYAFEIPGANLRPLHSVVQGAFLQIQHFAKEFGSAAVSEVARLPIGQHEMPYQMPAIPPGMTLAEALKLMDEVDVTELDHGRAQLDKVLLAHYVPPDVKARRLAELKDKPALLRGEPVDPDTVATESTKRALEAHGSDTRPRELGAGSQGQDGAAGGEMSRVRPRKKPRAARRGAGES
jgi:hypothetical protein